VDPRAGLGAVEKKKSCIPPKLKPNRPACSPLLCRLSYPDAYQKIVPFIILTVVLYGCDILSLTRRDKLDGGFENRALRIFLNPSEKKHMDNGDKYTLRNFII
jgi:hypothetical protein